MWSIFLRNVQLAIRSGQYSKSTAQWADFIAKEYDKCMKMGGDSVYGVPVMNGNVTAMADALKIVLDRAAKNEGNVNLLEEIDKGGVFNAYWLGAQFAPFPNPLFKPLGWMQAPPTAAGGKIIGPDTMTLTRSAATLKAQKEALQKAIDDLKKQVVTIRIPDIGNVPFNPLDIAEKIVKGFTNGIRNEILNHPDVKLAVKLYRKWQEYRKRKPASGTQTKRGIKLKFASLPDRKKQIKEAIDRLVNKEVEKLRQQIKIAIENKLLLGFVKSIQDQLRQLKPSPMPTLKEIKKAVKDKINGVIDQLPLPLPPIALPTRQELQAQIDQLTPSLEELKKQAYALVANLVPDIPTISLFNPDVKLIHMNQIVWGKPFVNLASTYLTGVQMNLMVMVQTPAGTGAISPFMITSTGYRVRKGPPVPPILSAHGKEIGASIPTS